MCGLDILRMVVSPSSTHSFRVFVVRHNIAVFRELLVTDSAFAVLFGDLSVEQFPHLGWGPTFPVAPGVVGIFDTLNTQAQSSFLASLLATTAGQRAVYWAEFIMTEFHRSTPSFAPCGAPIVHRCYHRQKKAAYGPLPSRLQ